MGRLDPLLACTEPKQRMQRLCFIWSWLLHDHWSMLQIPTGRRHCHSPCTEFLPRKASRCRRTLLPSSSSFSRPCGNKNSKEGQRMGGVCQGHGRSQQEGRGCHRQYLLIAAPAGSGRLMLEGMGRARGEIGKRPVRLFDGKWRTDNLKLRKISKYKILQQELICFCTS